MPWAAVTQAHSSCPHILATGFSLRKVIVATAINRSNMVVTVLEIKDYMNGQKHSNNT